jgi:hypothetical protein
VKRLIKNLGRFYKKPELILIKKRTYYEKEGFKHVKIRENIFANYGYS